MSEKRRIEKPHHQRAFETWYEAGRVFNSVTHGFRVSDRSARNWAEWFGWHERADKRDREAAAKADRDAVQRRAAMFKRHRETAELMMLRGREHFRDNKIERAADAIAAIVKGIEAERQSEGLPDWVIEILNADEDTLRRREAELDARRRARVDCDPDSAGDLLAVSNGKH